MKKGNGIKANGSRHSQVNNGDFVNLSGGSIAGALSPNGIDTNGPAILPPSAGNTDMEHIQPIGSLGMHMLEVPNVEPPKLSMQKREIPAINFDLSGILVGLDDATETIKNKQQQKTNGTGLATAAGGLIGGVLSGIQQSQAQQAQQAQQQQTNDQLNNPPLGKDHTLLYIGLAAGSLFLIGLAIFLKNRHKGKK